jgi:outer membrane lipoprotein carrier protein
MTSLHKSLVALTALLAATLSLPSHAAALDKLKAFIEGTKSGKADFIQTVASKSGRKPQNAAGSMMFSRPGKFRWAYVKPYPQLIVGDGARVWIYDEDLKQVTVRKLDQALGATPAALLAGANDALKAFVLKDDGAKDGLEWVEAIPREKESNFERIRMGFGFSGLERMELTDTFGQTTELRFTGFQRNARVAPGLFRFVPPQGADVIGDK